jgi:hypothetical protein
MHNPQFIDKKRRNLNLREMQVENILPQHFAEYYPKFISLLKKYYEFQEQESSTALIEHLFATRDINETDLTLLSYIEDELLLGESYFDGFGNNETELRAAANFSNILFRSKGTKFAIEWFFRSFYNEDVEVLYPKENIFKIGEPESSIGANSLKYLTDDKLYQTFALLVRVGISISKWKEVFKLFCHPAGMYLGGEVFLVDDIQADVLSLNDAIDQYLTPTYEILPQGGGDTFAEGTTIKINVFGTNVQNNGTDALYWWGEHLTTTDSDFSDDYPLYDYANKQYFEINNDIGHFYVRPKIDPETNPTESLEAFVIWLEDRSGRTVGTKIIKVTDVVPTWNISYSPSDTVEEGTPVTVTLSSNNPENDGNTTVYWYATGATTLFDSDLTQPLPRTAQDALPITITGDSDYASGSFTITPIIDNIGGEADEFLVFQLLNINGIEQQQGAITVTNKNPSLNVVVNGGNNVIEGNLINAVITHDEFDIGKTINWEIQNADSRVTETSGSYVVTSTDQTIEVETILDPIYQGPIGMTFRVTDTSINWTADDTFFLLDASPQYELTANPFIGQEGDTITYTVGGTNIPDGSVWFWIANAAPTPTSDADWTTTPPRDGSRQEIVVSGGTGSFQLTYAVNGDGNENYEAYIYDTQTGGVELASLQRTIIASGATITLDPDSYEITENIVESGRTRTVNVATGLGDGTYKYWMASVSGSGISSADFDSGYSSPTNPQTFTVTGGSGQFDIVVARDEIIEGDAEFVIVVADSLNNPIGTSDPITILDTSVPNYRISIVAGSGSTTDITELNEDQSLYVLFERLTTVAQGETIYFELSGTGASQYTSTQKVYNASYTMPQWLKFTTTGNNSISEADRTVTVKISRGTYASLGGTVLDTESVTLKDPEAGFSLVANDTTPNENTTVTFTASGSSIPDGTYYYRPTSVYPKVGEMTGYTSGALFFICDSSNLQVGMTVRSTDSLLNGKQVTALNASGVYLNGTYDGRQPNAVCYFSNDFDWFSGLPYGSFSIFNNSGTFNVGVADGSGTKSFTFEVFAPTAQYGTTRFDPDAVETITIQETTSTYTLETGWNDPVIDRTYAYDSFAVSTATIRFNTNGTIEQDYITGSTTTDFINVGNWITGNFNLNEFQIKAEVVNPVSGSVTGYTGATGSWLSLSSARTWSLTTTTSFNGTNSQTNAQWRLRFYIKNINDPVGTVFKETTLNANAYSVVVEAAGGGGTQQYNGSGAVGGGNISFS